MDFAQLAIDTKVWNTAWPNTTYLVIVPINQLQEATYLRYQGAQQPLLAEPAKRKIMIYQEINGTVVKQNWITNQTALLDQNWTLTEPKADA